MSYTNSLFGGSDMMGVCYAPYHQAATVKKSSYTEANVASYLKIISANNMTELALVLHNSQEDWPAMAYPMYLNL
jgi:hypothetical protein